MTTYILSLGILFIFVSVVFILACYKRDNSVIDIAYGLGFLATTYAISFYVLTLAPLPPTTTFILILITIWALRLSYRIYRKNKGKPEDFRYAAWRTSWTTQGTSYFYIRSYLQIFILQGLVISIVLLPFTQSILATQSFSGMAFVGLGIWIIGFIFESVGDAQLDRFIKSTDPDKGTIMRTGLWAYTRHPNYFGESAMWWGIACIALSGGASIVVLASPILITYLLLFVSGVPMLEAKWAGNKEWETYRDTTSVFIPLPSRWWKMIAK